MTREPAYKLDLPHVYSGKVRDIYDAGNNQYLMVTSDRISAFDVVMKQPVPDKGRVLMAMSAFWFQHFSTSMKSHLISQIYLISQPVPKFPKLLEDQCLSKK